MGRKPKTETPKVEAEVAETKIKYDFNNFSESYQAELQGQYKDSKSELSFKEWLKKIGY